MTNEERALWDVYVQTGRPVDIRNRLAEINLPWVNRYAGKICRKAKASTCATQEAIASIAPLLLRTIEAHNPARGSFKAHMIGNIVAVKTSLRNYHGLFTKEQYDNLSRRGVTFFTMGSRNPLCRGVGYDVPVDADPSRELESQEFLQSLESILTNREFRYVKQVFWEGKTTIEIGNDEGIHRNHVSIVLRKAKAKIAEAMGIEVAGDYRKRPVMCVETNERFDSCGEAGTAKGLTQIAVYQSARYGYAAKGTHWRFAR